MSFLIKIAKTMLGLNSPEYLGKKGEDQTVRAIEKNYFLGREGRILRNLYVPKDNGETVEIDLVVITTKGIFVVESKNYAGYIFGDERNTNWVQTLYAGKDYIGRSKVEKHSFYNPIWQNKGHVNNLRKYLKTSYPFISLVVFPDKSELKSVSIDSPDVYVCNRSRLLTVFTEVWKKHSDALREEEVDEVYNSLKVLADVDETIKQKHIEQIEQKQNNTVICPRCGGKLILRMAKNGPTKGRWFYGCSNYPRCKYTRGT